MAFVKYGRSAISNQLTTIANALSSSSSGGSKEKRVDLITSTQSWTAPAGVTYAIAHLVAGGGGGGGNQANGTSGGTSSAFGQNFLGGTGGNRFGGIYNTSSGVSAGINTGRGGSGQADSSTSAQGLSGNGQGSSTMLFGSSVVPGTSYTITVGAGGSKGSSGGNGGSGYVAIEYYVEA